MRRRKVQGCAAAVLLIAAGGCGSSGTISTATRPSSSEVAVSVVSGSLNLSGGTAVGWSFPVRRRSLLERVRDELGPVSRADAATWTCTGGTLSPTFAGPSGDPYAFAPVSCDVTWANEKTGSSDWSGTFTLNYGMSCDDSHAWVLNQAEGCSVTRTTPPGGNTRIITGPNGNTYAVTHDTHGAGTGWDASVTPAPTDGGVVITCGTGGCATGNGTLAINGSHLFGTVTLSGFAIKIWDHTVSTPAGPLVVSGSGTTRHLSGTVAVQHNLVRYTAVTTFNAVEYGEPSCCFPTGGSVTTTYQSGPLQGQAETLAFGSACGEAMLTVGGKTTSLTLLDCL